GTGTVACDVTNEPFDLPMEGHLDLVVKFGDEFNNDNEEVLILPHGEHQLDLSQYIYEMIVLAVPLKKIHPGIADGSLKSDILKKLEELSPGKNKEIDEIDPRWEDLKKLIIDKNK
ncbi:YceD family protein, partial [Lutimonas sp.]|uniref:YceD family protein n=1 Tax=Lutimonas sp. TaxID=1872403 RepID=UPI003C739DA4